MPFLSSVSAWITKVKTKMLWRREDWQVYFCASVCRSQPASADTSTSLVVSWEVYCNPQKFTLKLNAGSKVPQYSCFHFCYTFFLGSATLLSSHQMPAWDNASAKTTSSSSLCFFFFFGRLPISTEDVQYAVILSETDLSGIISFQTHSLNRGTALLLSKVVECLPYNAQEGGSHHSFCTPA